MARTWGFTVLTFLALMGSVLSCNKECKVNGSQNECKIRKRSVETVHFEIQEILFSFDQRLTKELANEMREMSVEEKETFLQDLRAMNEAAETEYNSMKSTLSDLSQQEIIKTLAVRVTKDFSERSWFKRLQSLAGNKIEYLLNGEH